MARKAAAYSHRAFKGKAKAMRRSIRASTIAARSWPVTRAVITPAGVSDTSHVREVVGAIARGFRLRLRFLDRRRLLRRSTPILRRVGEWQELGCTGSRFECHLHHRCRIRDTS